MSKDEVTFAVLISAVDERQKEIKSVQLYRRAGEFKQTMLSYASTVYDCGKVKCMEFFLDPDENLILGVYALDGECMGYVMATIQS